MKITETIRDNVAANAVNEAFKARLDTLDQESHDLAHRCYTKLYGKEVIDALNYLREKHPACVKRASVLKLNVGGLSIELCTQHPVCVPPPRLPNLRLSWLYH